MADSRRPGDNSERQSHYQAVSLCTRLHTNRKIHLPELWPPCTGATAVFEGYRQLLRRNAVNGQWRANVQGITVSTMLLVMCCAAVRELALERRPRKWEDCAIHVMWASVLL